MRFARVLVGWCVAVALASCAPIETTDSSASDTVAESSIPQDGGTIVRRLSSDVNTLNFVMSTTQYEKDVLSYIHAPLVEIDKALNIAPGVAEKWTVSSDGRVFTFDLDPKATFSDGHAVTSRDVLFTIRKIVDPKSESVQLAGLFDGLDPENTKSLGAKKVQIAFTQSRPAQLYAFNIAVLPEHYYSRGNFTTSFTRRVLGAGPYTIREIKPGESIRLQRRSRYWRERPHIESVLFRIISDDDVAWNALQRGEIDEMQITSDQWKKQKGDKALQERVDFRRFYLLSYDFIAWNCRDPKLQDARVRRALAMSLDRRSVISGLYYGTARMMTGPFTPDQWAYNPEVKTIEFDTRGARKLLEEAGWADSDNDSILDKGGEKLSIEVLIAAGSNTSAAQAQVYQQGLREAGVELKITPLDPAAMFERVLGGQYQATMLGWNLDLDPDLYAILHSSQVPPNGQNFVFYSNPTVDRLIERGRTELNQGEREKIYEQLHALLAEEQPYTWTVQVSTKWAINRRVRNVEEANGLGLFSWFPGPLQWWLAAPEVTTPQAN